MIALDLPVPILWALRWLLFLGPLSAMIFLLVWSRPDDRTRVGCLFAFLYGLGLIFATHMLAIAMGWWHYGGSSLMLNGIPADILMGGAILFGPLLYLAFPSIGPIWLLLPIVMFLHGTVFSSLRPLVFAGHNWFFGVLLVFAVAHLPAIYLARWTAKDERLPYRAALLAIGYGFLAFLLLPSLILHAMHEHVELTNRPHWLLAICTALIGIFFIIGLSAVQLFAVHGKGTPIPLDPTKHLVRVGLFSYVTNPMQLASAATWLLMGVALGSIWIASSALMAWVFVAGMVRWHHRHDLEKRFPRDWPEYRSNVPEWIPSWRPWIPESSTLYFNSSKSVHRRIVCGLRKLGAAGLNFETVTAANLTYLDASDNSSFSGLSAIAKATSHLNFAWAVFGAGLLLVSLPYQSIFNCGKAASSARLEADAS